jgi:hypothetical protein
MIHMHGHLSCIVIAITIETRRFLTLFYFHFLSFPFPCSYLQSMQKGEHTRLGQAMFELFQNDSLDDEELLQRSKELVAASQKVIQMAQENVDEYGQIDVKTGERVEDNK